MFHEGAHEVRPVGINRSMARKLPVGDRDGSLRITITNTECGRDFEFILKGHHLEPKPGSASNGTQPDDWYVALTEREKVDVIQAVLNHYRKASADPDGMKTAALGVVANPAPHAASRMKHLMYVSFNTTTPANKFRKGCAEFNVLNEAQQSVRNHQLHELGIPEHEVKEQKFLEFHVMGGRGADPTKSGDRGVPSICPCGLCTDDLTNSMVQGGKVYIYPHSKGLQQLPLNTREEAAFGEISPQQIWATTIDNLSNNRYIRLTPEEADIQKAGLESLAERLVDYAPARPGEEAIRKHTDNYIHDRQSIAELDIATDKGKLDPVALNDFFMKEILRTLNARRVAKQVPNTKEDILDWLQHKVETVRCVVLRTDDGCYHSGKDSRSSRDKAYVNAESASVSDAIDSLGGHGVERLYSMTVCPRDIAAGVMRTLSKEGLERAFKRETTMPGKALSSCSLLLNNGNLGREQLCGLADKYTFTGRDIYRGGFAGSREQGVGGSPLGGIGDSLGKKHTDRLFRKGPDKGPSVSF